MSRLWFMSCKLEALFVVDSEKFSFLFCFHRHACSAIYGMQRR